jgi:hypothetical protein
MHNRRRYERIETINFLQFKKGPLHKVVDTFTRDVSQSGACFFSEEPFEPGDVLGVRVYFEPRSKTKMKKARIVWCREHVDSVGKGYMCGLEFLPT